MIRWWLPGLLGVVAWGVGGPCHAADGPRPRVPPLFPRAECETVVNRADELFIEATLPYEDPAQDVELPDARTLQFFAVCEDPGYGTALPPWITWDDVQRADSAGLLEQTPDTEQVAQSASRWGLGRCVYPISAQRYPTTCEGLGGGVVADFSAVPAGNYLIYAYGFAPPTNLWTRRPGFVRVVDQDEEPKPAVNLTTAWNLADAYREAGLVVQGCAAGDGTTHVQLQWTSLSEDTMSWTTFAEFAGPGGFEHTFEPAAESEYQALLLRAVASDADGRQWVGEARSEVIVRPGCGMSSSGSPRVTSDACGLADDPPAPPSGPECTTVPSTGDPATPNPEAEPDGAPTEPTEPAEPTEQEDENASGSASGCAVGPRGQHGARLGWGWLALGLLVVARRSLHRQSI